MRTRWTTLLSIVWLMGTAPALADHPARLVLRSGQQIQGEFVDLYNGVVTFRRGAQDEQRVSLDEVAAIDFGQRGSSLDRSPRYGRHLLVLNSGREIEGTLEGLAGNERHASGEPLVFLFRAQDGPRVRARAEEIAYLQLAPVESPRGASSRGRWRDSEATVQLRDGERLAGDIRDLDRWRVTIALADAPRGSAPRIVALSDVAAISFGGSDVNAPPAFVQRRGRADQLLVLRDGRQLEGRLVGQGRRAQGNEEEFMFRERGGGIVTFSPSDAEALYLADASESTPAASARQVRVPSDQEWTPTGIQVREGDELTFSATGEIQLSTNERDKAAPAGAYSGRVVRHPSLRNLKAGALLGRVNGVEFAIPGQNARVRMPATGELMLGVNDDYFQDNRGQFVVSVTMDRDRWARR